MQLLHMLKTQKKIDARYRRILAAEKSKFM